MTYYNLYLNKLVFNSRKYILEMLSDRGFDVKPLSNYTETEIITLLEKHSQASHLTISALSNLDIKLKHTKNNSQIIVKYRLDNKFKNTDSLKKQISSIFEENKLNKETDCLIILNIARVINKPGVKDDPIQNLVNFFYLKKIYVQIFGLENFMFNIYKHIFVPKHVILSKQEGKDVLDKYYITLENLPKIKREDAIAKYIGLRPNDVVKISSFNATTGSGISYRVCISE